MCAPARLDGTLKRFSGRATSWSRWERCAGGRLTDPSRRRTLGLDFHLEESLQGNWGLEISSRSFRRTSGAFVRLLGAAVIPLADHPGLAPAWPSGRALALLARRAYFFSRKSVSLRLRLPGLLFLCCAFSCTSLGSCCWGARFAPARWCCWLVLLIRLRAGDGLLQAIALITGHREGHR